MKLIVKYNRAFFPVIIILLLIFSFVSYLFTKKVLQDEVDESLVRTEYRLTQFIDAHQELPVMVSFDDVRITIEPTNVPMSVRQIISTTLSVPGRAKNHPARVLIFTVKLKGVLHKISVLSPLEGVKTLTKTLLLIYLISFCLAFLILIFISRWILKRIWAPFYNSLKLVKEFKIDDNKVISFPVTEIEEFKEMNHNFESATTNAQNDYKRLKEFTENASHEIQTPLAVIRSKLNLLAQEDHLKESASLLLEDAFDAVTKLTNLNQSLLLLAKIENNQFLNKIKVNLSEALEAIIHRYQELWQNSNIGLMSQIDPVFVHAHNDLMDILLNNLISNATRHNVVGGQISIRLESGRLTIINTGRHKALDPDQLFGRFYKESANSNHNGLGLAIIKEICLASSFSVVYKYNEGMHTFCLEW